MGIQVDTFYGRYSRVIKGIKAGGRMFYPESAIDAELARRAVGGPGMRRSTTSKEIGAVRVTEILPDSKTYSGETSAAAFELFMVGKTLCNVVVELKLTIEVAEHLWDKYQKHARAFLVDTKSTIRLRAILEDWREETPTGVGLVDAIVRLQQKMVREIQAATAPGDQLSEEEAARIEREAAQADPDEVPPAKSEGAKAA